MRYQVENMIFELSMVDIAHVSVGIIVIRNFLIDLCPR